jgi:hypothetical protein
MRVLLLKKNQKYLTSVSETPLEKSKMIYMERGYFRISPREVPPMVMIFPKFLSAQKKVFNALFRL